MAVQLIGRTESLGALEQLLAPGGPRLVTLTGPGGIGKTRLALAAAERAPWPCAHVVDLSAVNDPGLVPTAIANALGLPDTADHAIVQALEQQPTLLLLDNFEHVLLAAADVARLLADCADLHVLVTSRAPLHLPTEHELPVQPLDREASRTLFMACASAARADFRATASNTAAIDEICARLDGIPLAIELAAARVKILSAEQIAHRLADCFRVLAGGGDDRPPRHRTLRATLDWSYVMLDERAQTLLRQMAVFAGGASIEAVEHVCADDPLVFDTLAHLVDQSLVLVTESSGVTRYRLLEPVRQYALEQLCASGQNACIRDRHAAWCLALADRANAELLGAEQQVWLDCLQREYANMRHANAWYLEQARAAHAQQLAGALWKFCEVRGRAAEGERWLDDALNLGPGDAASRSKALHGAANLAFVRGDYDRATVRHEESLALRKQLGDPRAIAITLFHLASVMRNRGDVARSLDLCRESLAMFRELDDLRWCAITLNSLGMTLLDKGAFAAARAALEEALALYRRLGGPRGLAVALGNLADLDRFEADYDRADARLRQSLQVFDELGDPWGSGATLESLALVACARGSAERAAVLFGAAEAQRADAGALLPPADTPAHEQALATLRVHLGAPGLESALSRGRALSRSAALAFAQPCAIPVPPVATRVRSTETLTEREREVAALVARGLSNRQIADELVFTKHTADKHVTNILGKLDLASRAQLAVWWIAHAGQSSYF